MSGLRQSPALLATLRDTLRERRITRQRLAEELGVGMATVKRWLAGQGLTVAHLEDICLVAGMSLTDLLEQVAESAPSRLQRLSIGQERALAADGRLTFLFFSILNGWPPDEFEREFAVPQPVMRDYLERLERLGLIDRLANGRIRPLAARRVAWRRGGPLAAHFEAQVKKLFLSADFGSAETAYLSDVAKLSKGASEQVEALIEQYRGEFHRIAELDHRSPSTERRWLGILFVARTLDPALLQFDGERITQASASA